MKKIDNSEYIWAEKYRPQTVEDVILPQKYITQFLTYVKERRTPNMLFSSTGAGLGKCLHEDELLEIWVDDDELYNILNS